MVFVRKGFEWRGKWGWGGGVEGSDERNIHSKMREDNTSDKSTLKISRVRYLLEHFRKLRTRRRVLSYRDFPLQSQRVSLLVRVLRRHSNFFLALCCASRIQYLFFTARFPRCNPDVESEASSLGTSTAII